MISSMISTAIGVSIECELMGLESEVEVYRTWIIQRSSKVWGSDSGYWMSF